jgi:hypothetical protein
VPFSSLILLASKPLSGSGFFVFDGAGGEALVYSRRIVAFGTGRQVTISEVVTKMAV